MTKKKNMENESAQEYREPGFFSDYGGYAIHLLTPEETAELQKQKNAKAENAKKITGSSE